jgi:E-phenylitaconyl-CoA hydratase
MAVDVRLDGAVLVVTLDRPERLNALTGPDYADLATAWARARDDDAVRAVVLTGAGDRAFCTGADLKDTIPQPPPLRALAAAEPARARPDRAMALWKPVVAAVNGYCLGGGLTLLLRTDIRIAAEHATFGLPEVRWGIPVNTPPRTLARYPVAMQWMLVGDRFDAATALSHGLVNRVLPAAEVLPAALDTARRLSRLPPTAVQAAKDLVLRAHGLDGESADRLGAAYGRLLPRP